MHVSVEGVMGIVWENRLYLLPIRKQYRHMYRTRAPRNYLLHPGGPICMADIYHLQIQSNRLQNRTENREAPREAFRDSRRFARFARNRTCQNRVRIVGQNRR
jgi:hypothetical protein